MPFTTTRVSPPTNPRITILFSGLTLIRPGPNNTCEVGVNRLSREHILQVLLIVKRPNLPPIPIPLVGGHLTANFSIRFDPDLAAGNFVAFAPTGSFTRANTDNPLDYRWAVNLRHASVHPGVDFNDGARPIVTLKTGVLYTPHLTHPDLAPKLVRSGSGDFRLNRIAVNLAAAIILDGRKLLLNWRDMGQERNFTLPRAADDAFPNTTYTVLFLNDPANFSPEPHDELAEMYKVLHIGGVEIPRSQRWALEYPESRRSDEIPCLTTILE